MARAARATRALPRGRGFLSGLTRHSQSRARGQTQTRGVLRGVGVLGGSVLGFREGGGDGTARTTALWGPGRGGVRPRRILYRRTRARLGLHVRPARRLPPPTPERGRPRGRAGRARRWPRKLRHKLASGPGAAGPARPWPIPASRRSG